MKKAYKNLWVGNSVITNARRSIDGKIAGELFPSELNDAEVWFIRSAQEESLQKHTDY